MMTMHASVITNVISDILLLAGVQRHNLLHCGPGH